MYYCFSLVILGISLTQIDVILTVPKNTNQCGNLTCFNNGICTTGTSKCQCRRGYKGETCKDDLDECSRDPCMHRGHCKNSIGSYRCVCLKGWTGENEHCRFKNNSTSQRCITGWIGNMCQDKCLNNSMCRKTEECKKIKGQHLCICAPGWTGINCATDIDECNTNPSSRQATAINLKPCLNNQICTNTPGSYQCNCLSGWRGVNCSEDIDECKLNICQQFENCTNAPGYYNCTCTSGWKGFNCSEDINECMSNPCLAKEHCINTIGSFECKCNKGWNGLNCEIEDISKVRRHYIIVGSTLFALLLGSSVAVLIGIIKFKCGKVRENTTMSEDKPDTQVQQIVHNQRFVHKQRPQQQFNQSNYRLNQQQTLQLHVHVHPTLQSQLKEKNGQRVGDKTHYISKHNEQQHIVNIERKYNDQLESFVHYNPRGEQDVDDLKIYQDQEECQDIQDHDQQEEQQQHQQEEEHRSKYWLRKLNRYFIRITNPLWRY